MKHLYSEKSMPLKMRFLLGLLSLFTAAYFTQPWIDDINIFWWPLVFAAVWMPIMFVAMEITWRQYHSSSSENVTTVTHADTTNQADAVAKAVTKEQMKSVEDEDDKTLVSRKEKTVKSPVA